MAFDFNKLTNLAKKQEQLENETSSPPPAYQELEPLNEIEDYSPEEIPTELDEDDDSGSNDTLEEPNVIDNEEKNNITSNIIKYFSDNVTQISADKLHPYHNHTFSRLSDDEFEDLKLSISLKGIIEPLLVRNMGDGHFEIIAGHNRLLVAKALTAVTVPCRIANSNLTDDIADEIMVCKNLNRRNKFRVSEMASQSQFLFGQEKDKATATTFMKLILRKIRKHGIKSALNSVYQVRRYSDIFVLHFSSMNTLK